MKYVLIKLCDLADLTSLPVNLDLTLTHLQAEGGEDCHDAKLEKTSLIAHPTNKKRKQVSFSVKTQFTSHQCYS